MHHFAKVILLVCVAMLAAVYTEAFATPSRSVQSSAVSITNSMPFRTSALNERRWNFNDGQAPWGLKKNAEIWNGRVAQMAFVLVFLQELIQGKGVIQGLQEGDPVNIASAAAFAVFLLSFTAFLAIKGDDDYVQ